MKSGFLTPSDVMEYLYCPRFIYYMHVLGVEQHEHRRALVNKGRDMHELKLVQNKDYLRKKAGAQDKMLDVYLSSEDLRLVGRMDEVLILEDGTAAPLDYKYSHWENKIYKTHKMQQTLYSLLIEERLQLQVNRAFIVYIRSKNHMETLPITAKMKTSAMKMLDDIFNIIAMSRYPQVKVFKRRCEDCTYRNICVS